MKHEDYLDKIIQSILIGAPRVILTFGAGHPFDLLKTRMQADPHIISAALLSKKIFQETGIRGFYVAGLPNFTRMMTKESYRSPLRGFLTSTYSHSFPDTSKGKQAVLTGLSMAVADTLLVTPLERIKVWLMTKPGEKKSLSGFFYQKGEDVSLRKHLFKGACISVTRGVLSWCTFLVPEAMIREAVIKHSPQKTEEADRGLHFSESLVAGSLSGIVNGLFTLPFDTIKTNVQKESYLGKAELKDILRVGKELVAEHGIIKGLYPAFKVRLLHYIIVGVITSDVIQKVDRVWLGK